jgi:hypothetical protein
MVCTQAGEWVQWDRLDKQGLEIFICAKLTLTSACQCLTCAVCCLFLLARTHRREWIKSAAPWTFSAFALVHFCLLWCGLACIVSRNGFSQRFSRWLFLLSCQLRMWKSAISLADWIRGALLSGADQSTPRVLQKSGSNRATIILLAAVHWFFAARWNILMKWRTRRRLHIAVNLWYACSGI